MLLPNTKLRLWLYRQPTDMRKSFDALSRGVKKLQPTECTELYNRDFGRQTRRRLV
jgi:hypothetical protein